MRLNWSGDWIENKLDLEKDWSWRRGCSLEKVAIEKKGVASWKRSGSWRELQLKKGCFRKRGLLGKELVLRKWVLLKRVALGKGCFRKRALLEKELLLKKEQLLGKCWSERRGCFWERGGSWERVAFEKWLEWKKRLLLKKGLLLREGKLKLRESEIKVKGSESKLKLREVKVS